jgi:hypothetical protein
MCAQRAYPEAMGSIKQQPSQNLQKFSLFITHYDGGKCQFAGQLMSMSNVNVNYNENSSHNTAYV